LNKKSPGQCQGILAKEFSTTGFFIRQFALMDADRIPGGIRIITGSMA
jgi:hypothetical protein